MNPGRTLRRDLRLAHRASNLGPLLVRTAKRLVATYRSRRRSPLGFTGSSEDGFGVDDDDESDSTVAKSAADLARWVDAAVVVVVVVVNASLDGICARQITAKRLMKDIMMSIGITGKLGVCLLHL